MTAGTRQQTECPSLPPHCRLLIARRAPPASPLAALLFYRPLSPSDRWKTLTRHSYLHILPRRLCKIRILASSSSAMVRADCCRCSGAFSAGLSYPFMNAGRVEQSQPHCRVTSGPVHSGAFKPSDKYQASSIFAACVGLYFSLEMVGGLRGLKVSLCRCLLCNDRAREELIL